MSHRSLQQLLVLAVTLASALGAALVPQAASAQTRAALVRNVDEPGRVPYSESKIGTCNAVNCFFNFTVVPAGKRLVIEHINGEARSTSTSAVFSDATMLTSNTLNPSIGVTTTVRMLFLAAAGSSNIYNGWYFDAVTKAYVDAGSYAQITMHQSTAGTTAFSTATITGYLVDTTP